MPLIKCPECQQPVSSTAATCPNCGKPVKYKPSFLFVLFLLIVIGLIAAGGFSIFRHIQQTEQAQANFDETMRGADGYIAAMKRLDDHVAKPSPAQSKVSEPAAPPPPPLQPQIYTAVLKRPITFQLPSGNVTLPRGSQIEFISRDGSEVRVRYRGHQQFVPASDVDLR